MLDVLFRKLHVLAWLLAAHFQQLADHRVNFLVAYLHDVLTLFKLIINQLIRCLKHYKGFWGFGVLGFWGL